MKQTCYVVRCNNNGTKDEFDGTASFISRYHTCTVDLDTYCRCISKLFDLPLDGVIELVQSSEQTVNEVEK